MTAKNLAGMVYSSPDPQRLADFYREWFGLPFEKFKHGQIREHLECESGGIHFAILKKAQTSSEGSIVPSFALTNLEEFLDRLRENGVKPLHPIINIGDGKSICTIADPDGNAIRLIQIS